MATYIELPVTIITASSLQPQTDSGRKKKGEEQETEVSSFQHDFLL